MPNRKRSLLKTHDSQLSQWIDKICKLIPTLVKQNLSTNQSNLNSGEIINSEIDQRFPERLSKEHINTLPILSFEGKIHLITESKDVSEAIKFLRQEPVLGFDTETRPTFKKGDQYSVLSLIHI